MSTGAQVIVSELEQAGVEVCFGLPGVHNLALWPALGWRRGPGVPWSLRPALSIVVAVVLLALVGWFAVGLSDAHAGLSERVAAVLLYRVASFYLPPVWGFFAFRWLQRNHHI